MQLYNTISSEILFKITWYIVVCSVTRRRKAKSIEPCMQPINDVLSAFTMTKGYILNVLQNFTYAINRLVCIGLSAEWILTLYLYSELRNSQLQISCPVLSRPAYTSWAYPNGLCETVKASVGLSVHACLFRPRLCVQYGKVNKQFQSRKLILVASRFFARKCSNLHSQSGARASKIKSWIQPLAIIVSQIRLIIFSCCSADDWIVWPIIMPHKPYGLRFQCYFAIWQYNVRETSSLSDVLYKHNVR